MKGRTRVFALLLILTLLLSACSPTASPAPSAGDGQSEGQTVAFTDSAGRTVQVPKDIERLAPSGTTAQIVTFALAPDAFVGLSGKWGTNAGAYLDEKYMNLPVFGQFYGSEDLNLEALAAADPQVIIDVGEKKSGISKDMDEIMQKVGIPTVFVEASLAGMPTTYRTLGELLGERQRAEELAKYCEDTYNRTMSVMEKIGEDNKVSVLYLQGDKGLNVIAKGSYHAEMLDLLGDNLAVVDSPSSKGTGNEVSMEQILLWDPDVIIFAPDSIYQTVGTDETWKQLKAIQNGRYYETPNEPYNWMGFPPSVNRYLGMLWMGKILYPEQFDYDLYQEIKQYYRLFYHCDLSEQAYNELVANSIGK